jgi:hypothetical protein
MEKTDRFTTINSEISIVLPTWLTNRGNLIIQRVLIPYCDTPEQKDTPKWHSTSQKNNHRRLFREKNLKNQVGLDCCEWRHLRANGASDSSPGTSARTVLPAEQQAKGGTMCNLVKVNITDHEHDGEDLCFYFLGLHRYL